MRRKKSISGLKFQLFFWLMLVSATAAVAQTGTRNETLWSVQDTDNYIVVAFSPDGSLLALGRGSGNTSEFRNAWNGSFVRSFTARDNDTRDLAFTPDGQYLINGGGGGGSQLNLNIWRVADAFRVKGRIAAHSNGTYSVSISPDGQFVATSGIFNREIKIWHVPDMTLVRQISNDDEVSPSLPPRVKDVAFSPDSQVVASSDIYSIKLRRASDGALLLRIPSGESPSIAFSPNGQYIAAAIPTENSIKIWNVANGQLVQNLMVETNFDFPVIAFTPSGTFIAAGYANDMGGAIRFWRVSSGAQLATLPQNSPVHSLAFSPNGDRYAFSLFGGFVAVALNPYHK
jgi:WD40 repeat protein